MTEFQEHLRGIAYRMGLTYEEYMRLLFPLVKYDPADKIPVLPPGTKINFIAWDQVGHVPISTMADWTPGCAVSVAVAESDPNPWACRYFRSSPLRTWAGAFNPDMHNLKRVMETPPTFFDGPLGVPFDPGRYREKTARHAKSYRYGSWEAAGFVPAADVTRSMAKLTEAVRRRLNAAAIAHLIVAPAIDPADYDPPTIAQALDSWRELQNRYNREPGMLSAPPVDLDDFNTVFHEN